MLCVSVYASAQDHMAFMGVPIDGTISSFQSKIETKGFTKNSFISSKCPVGYRVFNGIFASYNCFLEVIYSPKTKVVFQCNVLFCDNDREKADNIYNDLKNLLKTKYQDYEQTDTLDNGKPLFAIGIKNENGIPYKGEIDLTKRHEEIYGITTNWIILGYQDKLNAFNNQIGRMNDL